MFFFRALSPLLYIAFKAATLSRCDSELFCYGSTTLRTYSWQTSVKFFFFFCTQVRVQTKKVYVWLVWCSTLWHTMHTNYHTLHQWIRILKGESQWIRKVSTSLLFLDWPHAPVTCPVMSDPPCRPGGICASKQSTYHMDVHAYVHSSEMLPGNRCCSRLRRRSPRGVDLLARYRSLFTFSSMTAVRLVSKTLLENHTSDQPRSFLCGKRSVDQNSFDLLHTNWSNDHALLVTER